MKLDDAIAELELHLNSSLIKRDAIQMGIEALKRLRQEREWGIPGAKAFLPGETEE